MTDFARLPGALNQHDVGFIIIGGFVATRLPAAGSSISNRFASSAPQGARRIWSGSPNSRRCARKVSDRRQTVVRAVDGRMPSLVWCASTQQKKSTAVHFSLDAFSKASRAASGERSSIEASGRCRRTEGTNEGRSMRDGGSCRDRRADGIL